MNCWFCYTPLNFDNVTYQNSSYKEVTCQYPSCQQANVNYKFMGCNLLNMIQFKAILNERVYYINYYMAEKQINVTKESLPTFYENNIQYSYESVLHVDYQSVILTPNNVNEKLSLFLLFT